MSGPAFLGWGGIIRLGLVQTAIGAIVVLTTSTMNRVMVVELALPAALPGALVAFHYALQVLRPRLGHGSDAGGRRTPWIVGGMAVLALGGALAAAATAWMSVSTAWGIALALVAFTLIGLGVGACGTSLLVLLAKRVEPGRRATAATLVWVMMIGGFALTAGVAGAALDPYSPARLVAVTAAVSVLAFVTTVFAVRGVEPATAGPTREAAVAAPPFRQALAEVWAEPRSRLFTIFVFVSMLAYSAQDLILEPFAGIVFGFSPGESTKLSGVQHGGVMAGMILAAVAGRAGRKAGASAGATRAWTTGGCLASALALVALSLAGLGGPAWPLRTIVFALGVANGAYAVAAIGAMMQLAGAGGRREGVRMGLWGAAQALAFGLGGFSGALASDLARLALGSPVLSYVVVFAAEAALFVAAAVLALRIFGDEARAPAGAAPALVGG